LPKLLLEPNALRLNPPTVQPVLALAQRSCCNNSGAKKPACKANSASAFPEGKRQVPASSHSTRMGANPSFSASPTLLALATFCLLLMSPALLSYASTKWDVFISVGDRFSLVLAMAGWVRIHLLTTCWHCSPREQNSPAIVLNYLPGAIQLQHLGQRPIRR